MQHPDMERDRGRADIAHRVRLDERFDRQPGGGRRCRRRRTPPTPGWRRSSRDTAGRRGVRTWRCSRAGSRSLPRIGRSRWRDDAAAPCRPRGATLVAEVAIARHDALDVRELDAFVVLVDERDMAHVEVRVGDAGLIVGGLGRIDLRLIVPSRGRRIGLPVREAPGRGQGPGAIRLLVGASGIASACSASSRPSATCPKACQKRHRTPDSRRARPPSPASIDQRMADRRLADLGPRDPGLRLARAC